MPDTMIERLNNHRSDLTIALCFAAGGWAMLGWGHLVLGGACFVAAVLWPLLSEMLTRYQANYAARDEARLARESQQLSEIAKREAEQASDN